MRLFHETLPMRAARPTRQTALFCLLSALCIFAVQANASQKVRVGVYENSPKVGHSASGEPQGIFIDLIEAIASDEGWTIEYVSGTWPEGLDRLERGEIDLMPDVARTRSREAQFALHQEPVLSDWFQIYSRHGNVIRSLLDLDGKRISVLERSIQQEAFSQIVEGFDLKTTLVPFSDYGKAADAVSSGETDAVIVNRFYGARHFRDTLLEDTAIIFSPTRLFFAAPKQGNPALLAAIDTRLKHYKADPYSIYYRTLQRWTSEEFRVRFPFWLKGTLAVSAILLLAAVVWTVELKRQVKRQTRALEQRNEENAFLYEKLQHYANTLEQRVAQRTEELKSAKEAAESADRVKSAFLATMSHELRTPLNSIIGFTGILIQGLAGPVNPEQHKQLSMVRDSSRHLLALINDVLDISKIEAGQLEVQREPFDLPVSIQKVTGIVAPLAEKKGLELHVNVAPELGLLLSDPRRIEQILLNLLNNAIKFTERGHVTLTAESAGANVRISVADTGIGIKKEDLSALFQPFRQIDTGLSRQHEGTGLGLAICRRLIGLLGGEITVTSVWGKGSVFTCTLPAPTITLNAAPSASPDKSTGHA